MGERKTYIINIDGMRADYFSTMGHQGCLTPTLVSLANQGMFFTNCKSTMPANTGTNHVAILTSTHAGSHGILGIGGYYQGLDLDHFRFSRKYGTAKANMYNHNHLQMSTYFNIIKSQNPSLITAFITGKTWLGGIIPDEDCDITVYPGNNSDNSGNHLPNPSYVTSSEGYVLGGFAHPEDNEIFPRVYIPGKDETESEAPPGVISLAPVDFDADKLPSDKWIIDQAIHCVDYDNPDFMYMVLMNMDLAGHGYGSSLVEQTSDEIDTKNLNVLRNPNAIQDQLFLTDLEVKRFIEHLKNKNLYNDARIIITSDHGMNTMKTLFSGETKKNIVDWVLERIDIIKAEDRYETFISPIFDETLDIDIREILAQHEIHMRASPDKFLERYNPDGDYDWCISEGPNAYIFNAEPDIQNRIKDILTQHTIEENGNTVNPVWKILTADEQNDEINDYTGDKFKLGKGDYQDVIWPSVIIFLKPHYMVPMYHDQLMSGLMPIMIKLKLPGFIDIRTATGAHGTYLEQDVPLILVSKNESVVPPGVVVEDQVSVLDIIPTISHLNGWSISPSFEGESLV